MIRQAVIDDIKDIIKIIDETIVEMASYNNTQWNKSYPQEKDFIKDISEKSLFICEKGRKIAGFICINKVEADEYNGLNWPLNENFMVIHRMAVNPDYRRMGIGSELLTFADKYALKNNIKYLKTDTYSINTKMNNLFKKSDYDFVGEIHFSGNTEPFYCYKKMIGEIR